MTAINKLREYQIIYDVNITEQKAPEKAEVIEEIPHYNLY